MYVCDYEHNNMTYSENSIKVSSDHEVDPPLVSALVVVVHLCTVGGLALSLRGNPHAGKAGNLNTSIVTRTCEGSSYRPEFVRKAFLGTLGSDETKITRVDCVVISKTVLNLN